MSWWNLPGTSNEWMGDSAADAAAEALATVAELDPKPTVDAFLDALEAALADQTLLSGARLGARTLIVRDQLVESPWIGNRMDGRLVRGRGIARACAVGDTRSEADLGSDRSRQMSSPTEPA